MQQGYHSLLLKDYSPEVEEKYVYSSQVQLVSNQKQVTDHLKYALSRVRKTSSAKLYIIYVCDRILENGSKSHLVIFITATHANSIRYS